METIQLLQQQNIDLYLSSNPQITFIRNMYRTYSNFVSNYSTYSNFSFEDNKQIFNINPTSEQSRIQNIYLSTKSIDNIKNINMYICKNNTDSDDYINKSLLHSYNKLFLQDIFNILNNTFIVLPFNNTLYGTCIHNYNYYIKIEIEYNVLSNPIQSIIINYLLSKNMIEINIFNYISRESVLVKSCKYIEYDVEIGNNNLLLNVDNLSCALLFFNFDTYNDISGTVFTDNILCPSYEVNKILSQIQCGNFLPLNTYLIDVGNNMSSLLGSNIQPCGHLTFNKNSRFIFDSTIKCKLYITFIYYDVLCFDNNIIYLVGNKPYQTNILPTIIEETNNIEPNNIEPNNIETNNINEVNTDETNNIEPNNIETNNINEVNTDETNNINENPIIIPITINTTSTKDTLYMNILKKYEMSTALTNEDDIEQCVISHDDINSSDYFYICDTCNKPSKMNELKEWLEINRSCPHCRKQYTAYPQLYIKK